MTETLKFEVGKHYRTRGGIRHILVYIYGSGNLLFINYETEQRLECYPDGMAFERCEDKNDIVAEWREPRTWEVCVVQYRNAPTEVATLDRPDSGKILARVTATEGEGLE